MKTILAISKESGCYSCNCMFLFFFKFPNCFETQTVCNRVSTVISVSVEKFRIFPNGGNFHLRPETCISGGNTFNVLQILSYQ